MNRPPNGPRFKNREEAGQLLAEELQGYTDKEDLLVLGLPRGGVPVAFEVAKALEASLDVLLVRKLGVPGQEELALGAISTGGVRVLNDRVILPLGISNEKIDAITTRETEELERQERLYRGERPPPRVEGRTVILVDDGVATGSSMNAAIALLRQGNAGRIVAAVPTGPPDVIEDLGATADDVAAVMTPEHFLGVSRWYDDFSPVTDKEVRRLLETDEMGSPDPEGEDPFIFSNSE